MGRWWSSFLSSVNIYNILYLWKVAFKSIITVFYLLWTLLKLSDQTYVWCLENGKIHTKNFAANATKFYQVFGHFVESRHQNRWVAEQLKINSLSNNPTEWSKTLKLSMNRFSVFDHFVELAFKGLMSYYISLAHASQKWWFGLFCRFCLAEFTLNVPEIRFTLAGCNMHR